MPVFAVPLFTALIENPAGQRFAVVEGVTASPHNSLSETFTQYATQLMGNSGQAEKRRPHQDGLRVVDTRPAYRGRSTYELT
jgi:hypothetical protein